MGTKNNEIQLLRAAGMLLILLGHMPFSLPNWMMHGYSFVTLFLMISGYFFALPYREGASVSVKGQLITRFFRLFPLMWAWILLYYAIGNFIVYLGGSYGDQTRWWNEIVHAFLGDYNYWLARQSIGGLFGQYWTFFVEIHFFLVGLVCFAVIRKERLRNILLLVVVLVCTFIARPLTAPEITRFATHCQVDSCCIGALISLNHDKIIKKMNAIISSVLLKKIIASVLLLLLWLSPFIFDNYYNVASVKYVFYNIVSFVILVMAIQQDSIFNLHFEPVNRLLLLIGNVSASMYAAHIIVFSCLAYNVFQVYPCLIATPFRKAVCVLFLMIISIVIGWISLHLIEKPYIQYSKKLTRKQ